MNSASATPDILAGLVLFFVVVSVFVLFALFVWSLFWVYGDAEKRGKSGCLIAFLVFFISWPLSLLFWLCARPGKKN